MEAKDQQRLALFIHTVITADGLSIPASQASLMTECQEWMKDLTNPTLKGLKDGKKTV